KNTFSEKNSLKSQTVDILHSHTFTSNSEFKLIKLL
ncbi:hypothetical protein NT06LI_1728, partial [Listeria innocua FSL J1-023]